MIGAELLNLMYGNPYNQLASAMNPNPAPNPNPNAPPQLQNLPPGGKLPPGAMPPPAQGGPPMGGGLMRPVGGPQMPAGGPQQQGAPNAPPPPPPGQANLPPTAATQSPPDLASLYLQMEQRNRSANEIDHGLNLMAASMSTPAMANAIMGSQRQGADPGAQLTNLIALQNMQRLNAARPAMIASLSSGQNALPPEVLNNLPTDQLQGLMNKQIDSQIALRQKQAESGIAVTQQGAEQKQKDLFEAQQKAPDMLTQLDQMRTTADQIKNAADTDGSPVMQNILSSSIKKAAAIKLMSTDEHTSPGVLMSLLASAGLTQPEQDALMKMKTLNNQVYGEAFQSTGSRRTGQEVKNLREGLSPLTNFTQSPEGYMSQFNQFQNQLNKSYVNTLGAAGRVDEIPENMKWDMSDPNNPKPLVNSAYLPGGDLYAGKGGQWASAPPKSNFDYASIPSGTVYTAPDGTQRRKP